jgi:hypothetical protein
MLAVLSTCDRVPETMYLIKHDTAAAADELTVRIANGSATTCAPRLGTNEGRYTAMAVALSRRGAFLVHHGRDSTTHTARRCTGRARLSAP